MSRLQKMLDKSRDVKGVLDIAPGDVKTSDTPKTGVGLMTQLSSAKIRIQELEEAAAKAGGAGMITIANISPNPWQPRRVFDELEIRKLAESINEVGLIQPISVRRKSVTSSDTFYELVAGERRLKAHQLSGKSEIKAFILDVSDEYMALMALAENLDREDLTDYETSKAIRRVESEFKTRTRLAEAIGLARADLYKYLAFSSLPDFVLGDLEAKPGLLGRNAAIQLSTTIKEHGDKAIEHMKLLWPQVKAGSLDQTKLAPSIEASIVRGQTARADRDIRKLFVGKEQAGSITKDASSLTVKIKSVALSSKKEAKIREFIQDILAEQD